MDSLTLRLAPPAGHTLDVAMVTGSLPCSVSRDLSVILALAACLESSHAQCLRWYHEEPIASLDRRTAAELVAHGRACLVLRFLCRCVWAETAGLGTY